MTALILIDVQRGFSDAQYWGPLRPGRPGNDFMPELDAARPDLVFGKKVNSAFLGDVDLDAWLKTHGITSFVLAGIQTNFCCETTARMGGNLGYDVTFALDATFTFDLPALDGTTVTADELSRVTAANLHNQFATVRPRRKSWANDGRSRPSGIPSCARVRER
ncbi:isochorismatase family protein [Amycolatopsis sp. NPDC023774]|uniref:isochorismatase family protein n=1 Tax=Amycolatopsis sp. NPDC023774 TaxID=3155015 RepID=UPI0033F31955